MNEILFPIRAAILAAKEDNIEITRLSYSDTSSGLRNVKNTNFIDIISVTNESGEIVANILGKENHKTTIDEAKEMYADLQSLV